MELEEANCRRGQGRLSNATRGLGRMRTVSMLYVSLIGYVVWGDVPDRPLLIGAAIVIASALYILRRESRNSG